jgi:hypothetical protein
MFARPLVWAGGSVVVGAIVVQVTRTGVDVLALLVALFVLLLIERTIGDWVADSLGPVTAILIFIAMAALGVTYVSTDRGRSRVHRIFEAAEAQGYHTAYVALDKDERDAGRGGDSKGVADTLARPLNTPAAGAVSGSPSASSSAAPSSSAPSSSAPSSSSGASASPAPVVATGAASSTPRAASSPDVRQAGGVRITRLRISPEVAVTGQLLMFRADLTSDGTGSLPEVEFSVDGRSIAQVRPDAHGIAVARWRTAVPGQYVVRARPTGGLLGAVSSATLNVLPGRR